MPSTVASRARKRPRSELAEGRLPYGRRDDAQARADASLDEARAALLAWFREGHRDMPWRRTRDPYAIWVSEIMLQQTRVDTVVPYFARFLARFPTIRALAMAPVDDVLALWSGLGYYARGRNLHRGAQVVEAEHDGCMPRTLKGLLALPGIGRYTAGAIASIAYDQPAPILDGNVIRVMTRLFALGGDPKQRAQQEALWSLAARWAEAGPNPGDANQSLMELGATVCTPKAPSCATCPAGRVCTSYARGEVERFPEAAARKKPRGVRALAALITRAVGAPTRRTRKATATALLLGAAREPAAAALDSVEVLMVQRPHRGLLAGLWDLPSLELDDRLDEESLAQPESTVLAKYLRGRLDVRARVNQRVARLEHVFTHRRLQLDVYRVELAAVPPHSVFEAGVRWIRPSELPTLPLSRLAARALTAAGIAVPPGTASRAR